MFYIGQEVICVKESSNDVHRDYWIYVVVGNTYVIRDMYIDPYTGNLGLVFEGIVNIPHPITNIEIGYKSERFRPVQKKQTDISELKALLNPINHKQLEDA
jgi:hypothetical protein